MEMNKLTKVIDKVHAGEMSKEQGFNRIEQIVINYWKEMDEATTLTEEDDIRREITYLFDLRSGILAGQVEGSETKVEEDIAKLCEQIGTDYQSMMEEYDGREQNLQDH